MIVHFYGASAQDTMFRIAFILLPLLSNIVDGFAHKHDVVKGMGPLFLTPSSDQYEGNRPIDSILHGKEGDSNQTVRKINHYLDNKRHKDNTFTAGDRKKINNINDISDVLRTDSDLYTGNKRKFTDRPTSKRQKTGDKIKHPRNIYQFKESFNEGNKASDEISNMRLRRSITDLLKLLKIFVKNPSEEAPRLTTLQNSSQEEIYDNTDEKEERVTKYINVKGRQYNNEHESGFINDLLYKLGDIIKKLDEKVSVDISKTKNNPGFILIKIPLTFNDVSQNNYRSKREVTQKYNYKFEIVNDTVSVNNTGKSNNSIIDHIKTFQKHSNNTDDFGKYYQESNNTDNNLNKTYQENNNSLRKSYKKIKGNVVLKIDSALKDVHEKIAPIKTMKKHYASDKIFKVGYIIANLETLELTLKKLITKLKANNNWSESSAQKVLDKIEISKTVVLNLMEFLRLYTESPNHSN